MGPQTISMPGKFIRVKDAESFEELLIRSNTAPVVIFKHSTTCSISSAAYQEVKRFNGDVVLVEVQSARELSREIERRTGITHQSPQVLVLRNGRAVWNASHWQVQVEAIAEAVLNNS
jgi:bacillithiol system protein YtxJ